MSLNSSTFPFFRHPQYFLKPFISEEEAGSSKLLTLRKKEALGGLRSLMHPAVQVDVLEVHLGLHLISNLSPLLTLRLRNIFQEGENVH